VRELNSSRHWGDDTVWGGKKLNEPTDARRFKGRGGIKLAMIATLEAKYAVRSCFPRKLVGG